MISNYKVKVNDSCNYKVSITDIQNKYKFKLFCAGADLTDYYTKEQVDQSQNTQDILIDNLLNQIPTGTATGETINITDSSSLPLKDIQEAGNTYQETTTGKNLFDGVLELGNYNSSTGEKLANNNYIINTNLIPVNELTNYKISLNGSGIGMYVFEYKSDYSYNLTARKTIDANSYLTTNSGTKYIAFRTIDANTDTTSKIQVETGTTASYWEKYTGGNPAPNPDYPQTITNVTGTNTIKIAGKNLFDKNNTNILNAYINSSTGVITADNNSRSIYISCKPNTTYTIQKILTTRFRVGYSSDTPIVGTTLNDIVSNYTGTSITITTGNDTKYLVAWICNIDTATLQEVLDSIQIEIGSTATTYEAYKEQSYTINLGDIELCKIGDYKDRIYYSSGKWYLEKNIGKVVLDGSDESNWNYSNTCLQSKNEYPTGVISPNASRLGLSTRFICKYYATGITTSLNNGEFGWNSGKCLTFKIDNMSSKQDYLTWLSNNNTIVYYILATPTTTEITDATLVSQLDALLNSTTYKTTTNIMVDTTNQKPTLTLTYRKDLETLIGG